MQWSNDKVLSLIDLYRDRPVLWNCKLKEYKDGNKRHDAFVEMAARFGVAKEEVERKLKNVICHFLREVKKERDSVLCGTGSRSEEVYKSKWFAYQSMEFLKGRHRTRRMADKQESLDPVPFEPNIDIPNVDKNVDETPPPLPLPEELEAPMPSPPTPRRDKRLHKSQHSDRLKSKRKLTATDEVLAIMKIIQAGKALRDQYTVFGEQIGMQIRDLPSSYARKVVKQIINTVMFDAEMGKYDYPTDASHPSSAHLYSQQPSFSVPEYTSMPGTSSIP